MALNFFDSTWTVLSLWMYTMFACESKADQLFAIEWNVQCLHRLLVFVTSFSPRTEVLSPYSALVPPCRLFSVLIFCILLTLRLPDFQALSGVLVQRQIF